MRSSDLQAGGAFTPTAVAARVVSENDNDRQHLVLTQGLGYARLHDPQNVSQRPHPFQRREWKGS